MGYCVCGGATLQCSFGAAPGALQVALLNKVTTSMPIANIMDNKPALNIPPFGMCSAPSNPAVIAATSAALGVFTPAPCVPATLSPWAPGSSTVTVANAPAVNDASKLNCMWSGVIQVVNPGQMTILVP